MLNTGLSAVTRWNNPGPPGLTAQRPHRATKHRLQSSFVCPAYSILEHFCFECLEALKGTCWPAPVRSTPQMFLLMNITAGQGLSCPFPQPLLHSKPQSQHLATPSPTCSLSQVLITKQHLSFHILSQKRNGSSMHKVGRGITTGGSSLLSGLLVVQAPRPQFPTCAVGIQNQPWTQNR